MNFTSALLELTKRDANGALIQLSINDIYKLIEEVDGAVLNASSNDTYLLFSGYFPDGKSAVEIASEIVSQAPLGDVHDIGSSEIGKLLNSRAFQDQLEGALAWEYPGLSASELDEIVSRELFGTSLSGDRISSSSIWDIASEKFVSEASGNFRLVVPSQLDDLSVFVQSELPALLENTNVVTIDGVARSDLKAIADSHGLDAVKSILFQNSVTMLGASGLFVAENRTSASALADFVSMQSDSLREGGLNVSQVKALEDALSQLDVDQSANFRQAVGEVSNLLRTGGSGLLRTLGPLSVLATFMIASIDASAAEENGDPELAREIRETWVIETTGSEAGSLVGGVLGAALAGMLGLSGWGAAAMVAIGMIGGGYFGAEGAVRFYEMMNELSDNQKSQVIQRLEVLFFGSEALTMEYLNAIMNEGNLTFRSIGLITESNDEIVANAHDDIAWRYALLNLNPFVVSGADYTRHNQNGELDWFGANGEMQQYSEEWIEKRASFLGFLSHYWRSGGEDGVLSVDEWDYIPFGSSLGDVHFLDLESNTEFTLNGVDFWLEPTRERIFGSANNDVITTNDGDDYLFGADGDDTLEGGLGNDYLEGGRGNDSYYFNYGDGNDTILDAEGNNIIYLQHSNGAGYSSLNGVTLRRLSENSDVYGEFSPETNLPANNTRYIFNGSALMISIDGGDGGRITIENFTPDANTFGLTFSEFVTPDTSTPDNNVFNYVQDFDAWRSTHPALSEWDHTKYGDGLLFLSNYTNRVSNFNDNYVLMNYASDGTELPNFFVGTQSIADYINGWTRTQIAGGSRWDPVLDPYYQEQVTSPEVLFHHYDNPFLNDVSFYFNSQDHLDLFPQIQLNGTQYLGGYTWDTGEWAGELYPRVYFEGGDFNDELQGHIGRDEFYGHAGDDLIYGYAGDDLLDGGLGSDTLYGGDGDDRIFGNMGAFEFQAEGNNAIGFSYYEHPDTVDYLDGGAGRDHISGGEGNDIILGGEGDHTDWLFGNAGSDVMDGGDGNDTLYGDSYSTGAGYRSFPNALGVYLAESFHIVEEEISNSQYDTPYTYNDILIGGAGDDKLYGELGNDTLYGGEDNDILHGDRTTIGPITLRYLHPDTGELVHEVQTPINALDGQWHGSDTLYGGQGNDELIGDGNDDYLYGGDGDDILLGDHYDLDTQYHGNDFLYGEAGNDQMDGGAGDDYLEGGSGNDTLYGGEGDDELHGNGDDDIILGGEGRDRIFGGDGNDIMQGGEGDDLINGGSGEDHLYGDEGNDILIGGSGVDRLEGGAGDDTYIFYSGHGAIVDGKADIIVDTQGRNRLVFSGAGITSIVMDQSNVQINYGNNDYLLISRASFAAISEVEVNGSVMDTTTFVRQTNSNGQMILPATENQTNPTVLDSTQAVSEYMTLRGMASGDVTSLNLSGDVVAYLVEMGVSGISLNLFDFGSGQFWNLGQNEIDGVVSISQDDVVDEGGASGSGDSAGSSGSGGSGGSSGSDGSSEGDTGNGDTGQGGGGEGENGEGEGEGEGDGEGEGGETGNGEDDGEGDGDGTSGGSGGGAGGSAGSGSGGSNRLIPRDPLVLDLDGDGVELTDLEGSNAYFDLNGDGFATRTSWLNGDDGFLAWDRNADGTINDISELFGSPERTGYEELADLDTNADGVIDANDERFADLTIWQDANGDGVSQSGELRSLADVGITSVSLSYEDVAAQVGADAQVARQGVFTWQDGSQGVAAETSGIAADVLFTSSPTFTRFVGEVTLDPEVLAVANIKGYGQMPDLHQAMSLDSGLKDYVLGLFSAPTAESLLMSFEELLVKWAGVDGISIDEIDPEHTLNVNAETGLVDFRLAGESFSLEQLGVIKQYTGIDVLRLGDGQWRENGEIVSAGGYYRQAYNELSRNLMVKFAVAGGLLSDIMPDLTYDPATDMLTVGGKASAQVFLEALEGIAVAPDNSNTVTQQWLAMAAVVEIDPSLQSLLAASIGNYLSSSENIDSLLPAFENPVFQLLDIGSRIGTSSADTIYGSSAADVIVGFAGNDHLIGRDGDDTLIGGEGIDRLDGYSGNDILIGGKDNDTLVGYDGDDLLKGGEGFDSLYGGNDDDVLDGAAGNDNLYGDSGNDTYLFGRGDDRDTIYNDNAADNANPDSYDRLLFKDDVALEDVEYYRAGGSLVFRIKDTQDTITVSSWFASNGGHKLQSVEFADGRSLDLAQVEIDVRTIIGGSGLDRLDGAVTDDLIYGLAGNDTLVAGDGNDLLVGGEGSDSLYGGNDDDVLDGGAGNDKLYGDSGNDTYLFGRGDERDTIYNDNAADNANPDSHDRLLFKDDVALEDVEYYRSGSSLVFRIKDTQDTITVSKWFEPSGGHKLQSVEFADGRSVDLAQVEIDVRTIIGGSGSDTLSGADTDDLMYGNASYDTLRGYGGDDLLDGGTGNDTLIGGDGNDLLIGDEGSDSLYGGNDNDLLDSGAGNDKLYGDSGNDTYLFGRGDNRDTIYNDNAADNANPDSRDRLLFKDDVTLEDVEYYRSGGSLVFRIKDTQDTITVSGWFGSGGGHKLQSVEFADGRSLDLAQVEIDVRTIIGGSGRDRLDGADTDDLIYGLAGNDTLVAYDGNDLLVGGEGSDSLYGGNDDDVLDGGAGNDKLYGDSGNDTYLFGPGDERDTIYNDNAADNANPDSHDRLLFKDDVALEDVEYYRAGGSLVFRIKDAQDTITVSGWFGSNGGPKLQSVEFADGRSLDLAQVEIDVRTIIGGSGLDRLDGAETNDSLFGLAGNDTLVAGEGDDILDGGPGSDLLSGGGGDDTYIFAAGFGGDTVNNHESENTGIDTARFEDASVDELWFSRSRDNLLITVAGTSDQVTVNNWYSSTNYQLDRIEAGSAVLLNTQVEQLVAAMASYDVPKGAGNVISQDVKDELQPVLTEAWQAA